MNIVTKLAAAAALTVAAGSAQAATTGVINAGFNYTNTGTLTEGDAFALSWAGSFGSGDLAGYTIDATTLNLVFGNSASNLGQSFTATSGSDVITFTIATNEGLDDDPAGGKGIEFALSATGAQTFTASMLLAFSDFVDGGFFQTATIESPTNFTLPPVSQVPLPAGAALLPAALGLLALRRNRKA